VIVMQPAGCHRIVSIDGEEAAVAAVLVLLVLLPVGAYYAARTRRRRRDAATMYITSVPGIELEQRYGGWNAEAYDASTGRGEPLPRSVWHSGPPSTWGRHL
jgi:hypothetical protein